jgi:probable rRNA maturation factor
VVILRAKVSGATRGSLERFLASARRAVRVNGDVNVLVTGNTEMRRLNREFRGKDKATDVLSFASSSNGSGGELAIAAPIAISNARRLGHSARKEVEILMLHGLLHLAGYDHERDSGEMARKEARLRRALGLPVGLIERVQPNAGKRTKRSRRRSKRS